jgi:uncharacterized protein YkwD
VSLTRGRVTGPGAAPSPGQDNQETPRRSPDEATFAFRATSLRVALVAGVAASLLAVSIAGRADGAERAWATYLAPASACPGSTDAAAPVGAQKRAVACLLNWARAQGRLARLARRAPLGRAARLKGRKVAACHDFSHAPCGADPTASIRATGYRYATFGENLLLGTWGAISPRDAVAAWLRSPGHRANILRPGFRHLGSALVRAHGMRSEGDGALWVTAFATPR